MKRRLRLLIPWTVPVVCALGVSGCQDGPTQILATELAEPRLSPATRDAISNLISDPLVELTVRGFGDRLATQRVRLGFDELLATSDRSEPAVVRQSLGAFRLDPIWQPDADRAFEDLIGLTVVELTLDQVERVLVEASAAGGSR